MKNYIKNYISFFVIAFAITPLYAIQRAQVKKEVATAQAIAQEVSKDISLLDQIIEQAEIIVNTANAKERSAARKELARLMNHKDLDQKVKAAIEKDIKIIQSKNGSKDAQDAHNCLLAISDKIEAEANAIAVAAQAAKAVESASPEELEQVVAEAQKNMQEADQEVKEEQGMVRRLYSRAKRLVTAPVDYIFGEESSKAKTAFYAAVGMAAAAAIILYGKREYNAFLKLKSDLEYAKSISFNLPENPTVEDLEKRRDELGDLWLNLVGSRGTAYLSEDGLYEYKKLAGAVRSEANYLYNYIDQKKIEQKREQMAEWERQQNEWKLQQQVRQAQEEYQTQEVERKLQEYMQGASN